MALSKASPANLGPVARIKLLCQEASAVEIDHKIPPKRYFRSGVEMDRMARIYMDEENLENAFILYMKFITLFVEKLPKHAMYNSATPIEKNDVRKKIERIFPVAEKLKAKLNDKYAAEYQEWKVQEEQKLKEEEARRQQLEAEKQKEAQRQEEEQQKQALARQKAKPVVPVIPVPQSAPSGNIMQYPGAPSIAPPVVPFTAPPSKPLAPNAAAVLPTAPSIIGTNGSTTASDATPESLSSTIRKTEVAPPTVNRSVKPDTLLARQDSSPINGFRRIYVPHELIAKFIHLAAENTKKNLETCGILTGKLAMHVFQVTHLIVPKQTATPDSCDTQNEEELFDLQDSFDLITLGWIHTHPSQTSFLSSVDLHTQYSYQQLMPEAIAIVCAPKFDQLGVYQLTPEHGLGFIGRCRKTGFHPHPKEPPLFHNVST